MIICVNKILDEIRYITPQEIDYRNQIITKEYNYMLNNNLITNKFYQLSHKIRLYGLFIKVWCIAYCAR